MEILFLMIFMVILYFIWMRSIAMLLNVSFPLSHVILGGILLLPSIFLDPSIRIFCLMAISYVIAISSSKDYKRVLISILLSYFVLLLVDCFSTMAYIIFFGQPRISSVMLSISINLIVDITFYLFMHLPFTLKFFQAIEKNQSKVYIYFIVLLCGFFFYLNIMLYHNFVSIAILLIVIFITVLFNIYLYTKEAMIRIENEQMLKLMEAYDEHLTRVRMLNHENRNLLLCLRGMTAENPKAIQFIDTILEEQRKDDYEILKQVINIPVQAIQGLMYQKLLICKEKKIPVLLHIDPGFKKYQKEEMNQNDCIDIVKILGIFLDNAIEESEKVKEKNMNIYLYLKDNKWEFQISNTFETELHTQSLFQKGYSTKGEGRGYGLSLVHQIVKRNKKLHTRNEIYEDVFIQYLEFDMKKN